MLAKRFPRQEDFDAIIAVTAQRYGVEPALIQAVIARESGFKPDAYNPNDPGGAWGLMQVIAGTARDLGHLGPMSDLFTPAVGIDLGTKYLARQQLRYRGVVADTVASYNAGSVRLGPSGSYVNQPYVTGVLEWLSYFRAYAAERGGGGGEPSPFLAGAPDRPGRPVDLEPDPEGVASPSKGPEGVEGVPRVRWPLLAAVTGAGLWSVLYFATCGRG